MKATLKAVVKRVPFGRSDDLLLMFKHGEVYIGLEMLVENLHEFDISISSDEFNLLKGLAVDVSLDPKFLKLLSTVRRDSQGS